MTPPVPGQHNHAAETLADIVRRGFGDCDCRVVGPAEAEAYRRDMQECEDALTDLVAALSSLQARHADAEATITDLLDVTIRDLEARLAETERQRDEARAKADRNEADFLKFLGASAFEYKRANAAEASAARAEDALREAEAVVARQRQALQHPRKLEQAALDLAKAAEDVDQHIMDNGLAQRRDRLRYHIGNVTLMVEEDRKARALAGGVQTEDGDA